jgi:AraC-like DNA-binding protein
MGFDTLSEPRPMQTGGNASLLMTSGRIAYRGLLGAHDGRIIGGICIYAAGERPFTLRREDGSVESFFEIVPAKQMHAVNSNGAPVTQLILEPETIQDGWFSDDLASLGSEALARRITQSFSTLARLTEDELDCRIFDEIFFGARLAPRYLDRRISRAVEWIVRAPAAKHSVERYAQEVGLSVSRLSHLFRSETGSTLRGFCAWRRVRAALPLISTDEKLIETALNAGYADSTHFCHAIRQFFGRRPRDILSIVATGQLTITPNRASNPLYSFGFDRLAA